MESPFVATLGELHIRGADGVVHTRTKQGKVKVKQISEDLDAQGTRDGARLRPPTVENTTFSSRGERARVWRFTILLPGSTLRVRLGVGGSAK